MYFEQIHLKNFRNIKEVELNLSPRLNIFIGENGQGKTNIVESIYCSVRGESFRSNQMGSLINVNTQEALIQAQIKKKQLDFSLRLRLSQNSRIMELQKKRTNSQILKGQFPLVIFSPESLSAIKDSAEIRRSLIDDLIVSVNPKNTNLIRQFRKVLLTRNKVLSNISKNLISIQAGKEILEALEPTFLKISSALTHQRLNAINGFRRDLNDAMRYISGSKTGLTEIKYFISDKDATSYDLVQIHHSLKNRIQNLSQAEILRGTSLVGPHRHEIKFMYNDFDSRFFCSQGQQRAIILAFKMAQIVYHRKLNCSYPILILDDVLSELDEDKQKNLVTFMHEINTQIFLTTTDIRIPKNFEMDNVKIFSIRDGKVFE